MGQVVCPLAPYPTRLHGCQDAHQYGRCIVSSCVIDGYEYMYMYVLYVSRSCLPWQVFVCPKYHQI